VVIVLDASEPRDVNIQQLKYWIAMLEDKVPNNCSIYLSIGKFLFMNKKDKIDLNDEQFETLITLAQVGCADEDQSDSNVLDECGDERRHRSTRGSQRKR